MACRQTNRRVIVVWTEDHKSISSLMYGDGMVRSYFKNEYDERLTLGREYKLPFFETEEGLAKHFAKNQGKATMCQIPVHFAISSGLYTRADIDTE